MKLRTFFLIFILLVLSIFGAYKIYFLDHQVALNSGKSPANNIANVYDRVISSGELKVAYIVTSPYILKESSTGKLSGIFYDFTEELGKSLSLRINWVEAVNLNNLSVGFENGRYDMIATPLWRSGGRARVVDFSTLVLLNGWSICVKK
jgi:ABC-type amino acid transport substrate-binding protein